MTSHLQKREALVLSAVPSLSSDPAVDCQPRLWSRSCDLGPSPWSHDPHLSSSQFPYPRVFCPFWVSFGGLWLFAWFLCSSSFSLFLNSFSFPLFKIFLSHFLPCPLPPSFHLLFEYIFWFSSPKWMQLFPSKSVSCLFGQSKVSLLFPSFCLYRSLLAYGNTQTLFFPCVWEAIEPRT